MKKHLLGKVIFPVLFVLISSAALAGVFSANAEVYSGTCEDGLEWSFDTATGELSITGEGAMANYSFWPTTPWVGCDIRSIVVGKGVTSIGDCAFYNCEKLASVILPDSVTTIGNSAFLDCVNLSCVIVGSGVKIIDTCAFYNCRSLTEIYIPNGVKVIGDSAFYECSSLESVTIPDSVTDIGEYAFQNCGKLKSAVMGKSVTGIDDYAFAYCGSLTSVEIPDSVKSIGKEAFYACEGLISVAVGKGVTDVGDDAFYGCVNLKIVYVDSSAVLEQLTSSSACGSLTENAAAVLMNSEISETPEYILSTYIYTETVESEGVSYMSYSDHRHSWEDCASEDGFTGTKCSVCGLLNEKRTSADPDLDGDGALGIGDVTYLLNLLSDDAISGEADIDLDGDGLCSIADVSYILNILSQK